MRLSINRNDSDQDMSICDQAVVRCNGITLSHCCMADEEQRVAEIYLRSADGLLVPGLQNEPVRILVRGDVQILLGDM